jgi:CHAT domain-containing protein/tetratricopeptide (TPR) repeat protein
LTRPFDKHLDSDELDGLVALQGTSAADTGPPSEPVLREAQRHVESCQDCSRKLQRHQFVHREILRMRMPNPSPPTPRCIRDAEWLKVAAGVLPEAMTRELMKHAAQCGHCGPLLKNAAETLVDETNPSEEAWVASLRSTRPEWRKNMAEKLRAYAEADDRGREKKEKTPWWQVLFSGHRPAFALAGLAAAVLAGWLGVRMLHPPSAEHLLAQAYTEHRTMEVRIPGAKYAPMRVERATGGSSLDKSPSLLKAEALIGENLRKNPGDPVWLQAKARADLLDGNPESAIKSLQRALETQPDDPHLLTDLGSAYFVRAESADHATDYGNAIESLSKALAKSPDDPIALFNRALSCERMFLYAQAVGDWEHYLRIDPQGEWAEDARANLQRVKQKLAKREKRTAVPLLSPREFSAAIDANHDDAIAMLDQRAERYLDTAIQSWLPLAYGNGDSTQATPVEARRALEYLADMLKTRHDDTWLDDFLQNLPDPTQKEASYSLLASDEALHRGRYSLSVELAKKSMRDFQLSSNQAGKLRAMFALSLAQTVALRTSDCLRTTSATSMLLSATGYRWLQAQTLIQQGQCQGATSQMEDALRSTSKGAELAKRFHYAGLQLRATAFAAGCRSDTGTADQGIRDLINGLTIFWQSDATNARGGNLYTVLEGLAGARNWHHVEEFTIAEQISDFPVQDPVDQAVQRELLAGAQERAGDYKGAQATLQSAAAQLANLPEDSAVTLRKAQIARENAKMQLQLGDAQGAAATLSGLRQQFETAGPGLFQADYFKTYGEASIALGLDSSAEPLLERALSVIEVGLRGLSSETDKLAWSRTQGQVYRDLLEIKLTSASPAQALALWEWYKGASLRSPALTTGTGSRPPTDVSQYALPPGAALISYAVLRQSTTAFVFHNGVVHSYSVYLPGEPKLQPLRFLSLCADPSSDLNLFNAESRRLYQILVAPLDADIQGATALRIETDGDLDQVPFDLLRGADGRYLADRFELTYSPGLDYTPDTLSESLSAASLALIVVASGTQNTSMVPLPEADDEGNDVATYFRGAKVISGAQLTRADVLLNLRDAQLFHFVGHAVTGVDRVGLVIGPDAVVSSNDLVKLHPRNLQLAVLSACDTANGDEGSFADVNSIARTLAAAGVPQTVASRWKVDSAVTRQLMRAFYSNLMSGKTPADSLRAATAVVRNRPGYQHPYYWGAFAVFGGS